MKILVATGLYTPEIGGPATHTAILERELPKRGVSVVVVPFSSVRRFPRGIRHFLYGVKLLQRGFKVDTIYALDSVSVGFPACIVALLLRKKFVLRVPGDYAWEQMMQKTQSDEMPHIFAAKHEGYPAFVMRLKTIQSFVAKRAHRVIVPSEYLKKIALGWDVPQKNISVVHSALDETPLKGNRRTLRGLLKFHGKFLISSGRLVPWKGFEKLIDCVGELKNEITDLKLMIIGSGPDQEKLEKKVSELFLEETVIFAKPVERDVLVRYIQAADAFVLNTMYEGFSHQLLEAMCMGTPIITTNVGGNPELIKRNENGTLVEYNNTEELKRAIKFVFDNSAKAKRMAERAEKDVHRYSADAMIEKLIPILS